MVAWSLTSCTVLMYLSFVQTVSKKNKQDVWTEIKNVIFVSNLTQITFGGCLKNDSNQIFLSGASNHISNCHP